MNNRNSELSRLTQKLEYNDLVKLEYVDRNNHIVALTRACCPYPVIGYYLWIINDSAEGFSFDKIISLTCESKGIYYNVNNNNSELEVIF